MAGSAWSASFLDYLDDHGLGTGGYSIPVGGADQEAPVSWRNLDQIRVTFSEDVRVDASDLSLTGVNQTQYEFSDFDYFPEARLAIWTLGSPLPVDRYWVELNADGIDPIADLGGTVLDGEWVNSSSVYSSGDGVAGGNFEFALAVLPGDALGIDLLEYNNLFEAYYRVGLTVDDQFYSPFADGDGNGVIETADWMEVWGNLYGSTPSGDPAGSTSDAPTTSGFDLLSIDDDAVDIAVSLYDAFEDAEDADSALIYTLESNSDASLFDAVAIDQATGTLTLNAAANASGRAELVLRATDTQGVSVDSTLTVDVDRDNVTPTLVATTTDAGLGLWIIEGWVTDPDDNPDDMYVILVGVSPSRVSVGEDGYFYEVFLLDPGEGYFVDAYVSDAVSTSNTVYLEIGWG